MTGGAARPRRWPLVLLGLPIGFAGGLAGIGGGLIASSLLHFGFGFDLRRATGTALVLVFATTLGATLSECLSPEPALVGTLLMGLLPGVLVGAQVGFRLSERLPERALRAVFAACMLYSAARLGLGGGASAAIESVPAGFDLAMCLAGFVAGLGGGLAAPLLGVGGGLVMVPVIHLGLGLSFDIARASSLAAGCLGAARSLRLKARVGRISWPHGLSLAAGSLVGSGLGVAALDRRPGLAGGGRWILCALLVYVGLRFLRALVAPAGPA